MLKSIRQCGTTATYTWVKINLNPVFLAGSYKTEEEVARTHDLVALKCWGSGDTQVLGLTLRAPQLPNKFRDTIGLRLLILFRVKLTKIGLRQVQVDTYMQEHERMQRVTREEYQQQQLRRQGPTAQHPGVLATSPNHAHLIV